MITLIAAAAENNALGKNNDLLWHLPIDFKRFKALTSGHHIIMGRKTFESLPGLLPNRTHVIITRQKEYTHKDCIVVNSLKEAIILSLKKDTSPFIIGGGEIYKASLEIADKIELTRVHASFEADTFFPEIDPLTWKLVNEEFYTKNDKHKYNFTFQTFVKNEN